MIADVERLKAADNDAAILAAFDEWKAAREFIAESDDEEADKVQWAIVDRAQALIGNTTARSPRAAEAALWIALDNMEDSVIYPHAVARDLQALLAEERLDPGTKLVVRTLATLRAMAGA